MRYARWLSPEFFAQLQQPALKGLLNELIDVPGDDPYRFDLQFREGDLLMVYHGTAVLLNIRYRQEQSLEFSAAQTYAQADGYDGLMRTWTLADIPKLSGLVSAYLNSAATLAQDGYYRNREEGFWQNRLMWAFGPQWQTRKVWLIIDREAVVGFESHEQRKAVCRPIQEKYKAVRTGLQQEDPERWGQASSHGLGNECDFLAIGPSGELCCIELKHGSNTSGIYWGGLQVSVYREIVAAVLPQVTKDIKTLVRQKVALGLLPQTALTRLPARNFRGVFPILAVAEANDRSEYWERLSQVTARSPGASARCLGAGVTVVRLRSYNDPTPLITAFVR